MTTRVGINAFESLTTGIYNTAMGYATLEQNTTGRANTAIGTFALNFNEEGNRNTAIGYLALSTSTSRHDNTASGTSALRFNSTGSGNTASGASALYSNASGIHNTAIGWNALYTNTTGIYNVAIGDWALGRNTTGSYNTALGVKADVNWSGRTNATAIGYEATAYVDNSVSIGNTSVVQIGGYVGWSNFSDIRNKKDIEEIGYGLNFIRELRPVQFRMQNGNDRVDFGFIGHEIEALLGTGYNILGIGGDADRTLSLRYTDFIAPMVKAIQEQHAIIETQKEQIKNLEERILRLESLMGSSQIR